jgi:type IV secretory pathway VirB2 component (pilin)
MKTSPRSIRYLAAACATIALALLFPRDCLAASHATLPWDYTLEVMQNFVCGTLADFVLIMSALFAALVFILAGDGAVARRFAKMVVGTAVALLAVQLLNYLAP